MGAPETGTSPLLEDLCLRSLFSPFSRFSFLFFFSFLCFLCEEFDEEEEAGCTKVRFNEFLSGVA